MTACHYSLKRAIIILCFIVIGFFVSGSLHRAYAANKIIAIVNRDTITEKELSDFTAFMRIQFSKEFGEDEAEKKLASLKNELLNRLIDDRLVLQEAKKAKIEIESGRIKARLAEIKKRYKSDLAFQSDLLRQGLSQADVENKMKEQMLMYAVIEREIRSKIQIRPDDVTSFYNKNADKFLSPGVRELDVFIFDNRNNAALFSYNLRIGKKVEDLATRYSFTFEQLKASTRDELKKEISDAVFKLGPNQVSEPVPVDKKFYVFRLVNIVLPKQQALLEAQDSIYAYLFDQRMQEEMTKWLGELKKQSYIKILKN